jgi:ribosomal protein L36
MKRLTVLATLAVAIGAFALISGAGAAPPNVPHSITLTFTEQESTGTFKFLDIRPLTKFTHEGPRRVSPGDGFAVTDPLLDTSGARAGKLYVICHAANGARRFSRVRFICQGEARLKTGTLSITALFRDVGQGAVTGEVVGGSGAYEGANGGFTSSGGENAVDNFHIVTFSS